jgi:hypothetical protein
MAAAGLKASGEAVAHLLKAAINTARLRSRIQSPAIHVPHLPHRIEARRTML